jgi:hypothetical protein
MSVVGAIMTKLDNLNLNLNLNLAAAAAGAGAPGGRIRFNTEDFPKAARLLPPPTPPRDVFDNVPTFSHAADWDAEGRAWLHLCEFAANVSGGGVNGGTLNTWLGNVQNFLDTGANPAGKVHRCPAGPHATMTTAQLNDELNKLVDAALDRGDRLQEIIDQADGEGALNYWTGMLGLIPSRRPNTHLLIRVGRKIGELVVMRLKGHYQCPRPSRIHPFMVPAIDPPDTPAYPAGHSLQAHLISRLLIKAMDDPQTPQHLQPGTLTFALKKLAKRVAENRKIAGIHYEADNEAGKQVSYWILRRMALCTTHITPLIVAARAENT